MCAVKSLLRRGCKPHICPVTDCKCYSKSVEHVCCGGDDNNSTIIRNPVVGDSDFIEQHLPVVWVKQQHRNEVMESSSNEAIAISCTKIKKNENGKLNIATVTSTFVLRHNEDGRQTEVLDPERSLEEVGSVFSFMHHPIVVASSCHRKDLPREYLEFGCNNQTLLVRAMFAMSTGKSKYDKSLYLASDSQDHQKQYLAATISSDILLRNLRDTPGPFQLMLGEVLIGENGSKQLKDLCSSFNLAPSWKYTLKSRAITAKNQMETGIKVGARDLVLLFFDNVGFKILGRQASYDQWILINTVVVPEYKLKTAGFYQDNKPDNERISRVPDHIWEEATENISVEDASRLAQTVVGIQDRDFDLLAKCTLENIKFVCDHVQELGINMQGRNICIPRFDRIISGETRAHMDDLFKRSKNTTSDVADVVTVNLNDNGAIGVDGRVVANRYVRNNAKLEVVNEDLADKASVKALMRYLVGAVSSQLTEWDSIKHLFDDTAESPLAGIMAACGCDGQPAEALRRVLEEDALKGSDSRQYPASVFVSFGGFHTLMKGLNASGEYFTELLKDIFSSFRDTWKKVEWILYPSDPRQREYDSSCCLLAHIAEAERNLRKHYGRKVLAVEVNDFMLERATEFPICAFALLEIRVTTVLKLMRNSEKLGHRGCVQTYLSTIRLIMPLFAVTHKTDYMNLCQGLLKWYYCSSPAQRKIYEEFIFTQLSTHGSSIFHDNCVEQSVKDLRKHLGKNHRRGMPLAMELAAASIPLSDGSNSAARNLHNANDESAPSSSRTHDILSSDCPYYKVSSHLDNMRLWHHGVAPIIQGDRKGKTIECKEDILK